MYSPPGYMGGVMLRQDTWSLWVVTEWSLVFKVVLHRSPRCQDNHDLSECHRLYDLSRHIEQPYLPPISLTASTLTSKKHLWDLWRTTLICRLIRGPVNQLSLAWCKKAELDWHPYTEGDCITHENSSLRKRSYPGLWPFTSKPHRIHALCIPRARSTKQNLNWMSFCSILHWKVVTLYQWIGFYKRIIHTHHCLIFLRNTYFLSELLSHVFKWYITDV